METEDVEVKSTWCRKIPSSNLFVEAAACFLTSSASKEINRGVGDFLPLNSHKTEITCSATYTYVSDIVVQKKNFITKNLFSNRYQPTIDGVAIPER